MKKIATGNEYQIVRLSFKKKVLVFFLNTVWVTVIASSVTMALLRAYYEYGPSYASSKHYHPQKKVQEHKHEPHQHNPRYFKLTPKTHFHKNYARREHTHEHNHPSIRINNWQKLMDGLSHKHSQFHEDPEWKCELQGRSSFSRSIIDDLIPCLNRPTN